MLPQNLKKSLLFFNGKRVEPQKWSKVTELFLQIIFYTILCIKIFFNNVSHWNKYPYNSLISLQFSIPLTYYVFRRQN